MFDVYILPKIMFISLSHTLHDKCRLFSDIPTFKAYYVLAGKSNFFCSRSRRIFKYGYILFSWFDQLDPIILVNLWWRSNTKWVFFLSSMNYRLIVLKLKNNLVELGIREFWGSDQWRRCTLIFLENLKFRKTKPEE